MTPSRAVAAALLFALAQLPAAHAGVVVVDPQGGPGGGQLLQSALNAAQSGDILLLRPGDYTDKDILLPGKLVSLVADAGGAQVTLRRLQILLPGLHGTLLVRGIRAEPPQVIATKGPGIETGGGFGLPVVPWFEDCTAFANPMDPDGPGGQPAAPAYGMVLQFTSPAVLVRCEATGSPGLDAGVGWTGATGGGGGLLFAGMAAAVEGTFTGGAGGDGPVVAPVGADGGHGVAFPFGIVDVMGCTLRGGDEGAGNDASVKPGAGLWTTAGQPALRDVDAEAGAVVGSGTPVADVVSTKPVTLFPAATRGLAMPGVVREGEVATLAVHGQPGDDVFAHLSAGASVLSFPSKQGALVLASTLPAPLFLGRILDPAGTLEIPITMPALPAGFDGFVLYMQAFMRPAGGGLVTGSGSACVWLDATL
jgi:hypothetical protein